MLLPLHSSLSPLGRGGVVAAAPANPLFNGLRLWTKLDEGSGTVIGDSSGNGNNGTATAADWVTDDGRNVLHIGGSDSVSFGDGAGLGIEGQPGFTVTVWLKPDSLTPPSAPAGIATKHANSSNRMFQLLQEANNSVTFGVRSGASNAAINAGGWPLQTNNWKFLAGTFDGSTVRLYVDTAFRNVASLVGITSDTFASLILGGVPARYRDFRIWNRALSQTEIVTLAGFSTMGTVAVGGSTGSTSRTICAGPFTAAQNGTIKAIWVYGHSSGAACSAAVYGGMASLPGARLAMSATQPTGHTSAGWLRIPIECPITAGTIYWLSVWANGTFVYNFVSAAGYSVVTGQLSPWPSWNDPYFNNTASTSRQMAIYAEVAP